jgi:hypothetical protein
MAVLPRATGRYGFVVPEGVLADPGSWSTNGILVDPHPEHHTRLVGRRPELRVEHDRFVLRASDQRFALNSEVSFAVDPEITTALRPGDHLRIYRNGNANLSVSVLRDAELVVGFGAPFSAPLQPVTIRLLGLQLLDLDGRFIRTLSPEVRKELEAENAWHIERLARQGLKAITADDPCFEVTVGDATCSVVTGQTAHVGGYDIWSTPFPPQASGSGLEGPFVAVSKRALCSIEVVARCAALISQNVQRRNTLTMTSWPPRESA